MFLMVSSLAQQQFIQLHVAVHPEPSLCITLCKFDSYNFQGKSSHFPGPTVDCEIVKLGGIYRNIITEIKNKDVHLDRFNFQTYLNPNP